MLFQMAEQKKVTKTFSVWLIAHMLTDIFGDPNDTIKFNHKNEE